MSVYPQPVRPGKPLTVAVMNAGNSRVQRVRVEPGDAVPLIVENPATRNDLTIVVFDIPETAEGDSARVTLWLRGAVLARAVAPQTEPASGEHVYVQELPEVIEKQAPTYPPAAQAAGVAGTVMVMALVGTDGLVKETRVVKSIAGLDAAAVACVRKWRFKPALARNEPVPVWVAVPVRFEPSSNGKR